MARLTAPLARVMAGRRFFPLWAVVHHRGRKTGRDLSVPVAVRPVEGGLLIALPWGAGTNWARNVLAAGGCALRWRGTDHRMTAPELVGRARALASYSPRQRAVVERVIKTDDFLVLHF
jgi:deazaflavin-dependent oxidoreductase (nitroreductase family)